MFEDQIVAIRVNEEGSYFAIFTDYTEDGEEVSHMEQISNSFEKEQIV